MNDPQGDKAILDVLRMMGADFVYDKTLMQLTVISNDNYKGIAVDINHIIDAITPLAVMACFADTPSTFTGAVIARKKECDRITCIDKGIKKSRRAYF